MPPASERSSADQAGANQASANQAGASQAGANQANANQADPRTYFAEERTFLAWIRTGIALMGFGFVVARFGLFLRELASLRTLAQFQTSALSVPLGTALLMAGVLVNILACVRHVRIVRALNSGVPIATKPSTLAIIVALLLAAAGLSMAIYLSMELAQ